MTDPVALTNQIFKLEKKVSELKAELKYYKNAYKKYKKGYAILIKQWDFLPDDIKESVHKELGEENL